MLTLSVAAVTNGRVTKSTPTKKTKTPKPENKDDDDIFADVDFGLDADDLDMGDDVL